MKNKFPALNLLGRLLFETIAVVIGVSIAFFVDNWKDNRKTRQNEISLLQALKSDIITDSLSLTNNIKLIDLHIATYTRILERGFSKDSATFEIDMLLNYIPYRPVDLSYKEMQQTGTSGIIANKTLLYAIITLNEKLIGIINEAITIDRSFILERMIPFMEKYAAYPYDQRADNTLMLNAEFKNLVRTNILYKNIDKTGLMYYKQYAVEVVKKIDAELQKLQD